MPDSTTRRTSGPGAGSPDETRQALIGSAVRLFGTDGFHATSVQRIVADAGLTKGAFYHHFASKEDLLREMHDAFIDHQLRRAREVLAADLPADEMLRRFVTDVLLDSVARFRAEMTTFFQERRFLSGQAFSEVKAKRDEFERCALEVIERGIERGEFRDVGPSARILAFGVIGMCAWAYNWLDPAGSISAQDIGGLYADVLLDGLRPEER